MIIRTFSAGDKAQLINLWQQCNLTVPYNNPEHDIALAAGQPNSDILVAIGEEKIIASVMVGHDGHRGWLYYVAVEPAYQHKAIGSQIVEAAETWLKEKGIGKVQILIRESNTAVKAFYQHIQYEEMPRIVMQKWLINPKTH